MNPGRFVTAIIVFALVGWGSFISIVTYTTPDESNAVLFLFYLSFGVAIFSVLTLLNFYLRKRLSGSYPDKTIIVAHSVRQGFILTLFFIFLLVLRSFDVLSLLVVAMMLILVVGIELYMSKKWI